MPAVWFTQYHSEMNRETGTAQDWESKPDFCLILAYLELAPVVGLELEIGFYPDELPTYYKAAVWQKEWIRSALTNCPVATDFLKLPSLAPRWHSSSADPYSPNQRQVKPFIRFRRPITSLEGKGKKNILWKILFCIRINSY